jgi:hypothetical protein
MNQQFSYRIAFLFFILFFWLTKPVKSQEPCGTMQVLKEQLKNDPDMQKRIDERDKQMKMYDTNPQLLTDDVIVIPVVVHVIYHTAAQNISDAQIESQIAVLNEDFTRQNADTVNTPAVFKGRAANINLRFALAIRDPNGEATSGITRTYTHKTTFSTYTEMKNWPDNAAGEATGGHDAWPATDYLNVWICNLDGISPGLRGFATFPDLLDDVDGIVVEPDAFGRGAEFNLRPKYDLGRTATHEVGHWLRLSHIWGDGNCDIDDGIGDTPSAIAPNRTDTPCTFPGPNSCPRIEPDGFDHPDMFQNYMDYSIDQCMNLFTEGQKSLMRLAFAERGSRVSIRSSLGLTSPMNCNELTLTFKYDSHPEEISWTIVNKSTNDTVAVGKKYERPNEWTPVGVKEDIYKLCLADGDYTFTIVDSFGDGMVEGEGDYNLKSRYDTLHISDGNFMAGESFDFSINDRYYRFVGPGTDWHDDVNWNRKVPSTFAEFGKITIESDCIKRDGLEITPPNILDVKHGVTFSATAIDRENVILGGLVAHYPFSGNANDTTGNGNNGVVNGATLTTDRFGNVGKAYAFDGIDDMIRITQNANLNAITKTTISFWAYHNQVTRTTDGFDWQAYISKDTPGKWFTTMLCTDPSGCNGEQPLILYTPGLSKTDSRYNWSTVSPNVWYYITLSNDGTVSKIYVNGTVVKSENVTGSLTTNTSDIILGRCLTGSLYPLDGKLDDLRIYNRALSDAEVTALYNAEKP